MARNASAPATIASECRTNRSKKRSSLGSSARDQVSMARILKGRRRELRNAGMEAGARARRASEQHYSLARGLVFDPDPLRVAHSVDALPNEAHTRPILMEPAWRIR